MQFHTTTSTTTQVGTVVAVADAVTRVSVRQLDCSRCRAGKGCGAALLGGTPRDIELALPTPAAPGLKPGDRVRLVIEPRDLLRGIVFAYGLPLAGGLAAAGACLLLASTAPDWLASLVAASGVLGGAVAGSELARRQCARSSLLPRIAGIAHD